MTRESYLAQFYGKSQNYTDIPNKWYKEYNVKKGLRNEDGTGVRVGLTRVADVVGYSEGADGQIVAIPGELYYRGYNVVDLVKGKLNSHFGYEEVCFLLLFGYLPKRKELDQFCAILRDCYEIPDEFVEMNLLRMPGKNLMNKLQDAVLTLYNYDDDPDNTDVYETLVKGINLVAKLPSIACYAYQSKVHYYNRDSLFIHYANPEYSIAENFLSVLRKDQKFTDKEASLLDTILMLHADHGGGNNSTFTNVVISSTGTDIYSTVSASIGSTPVLSSQVYFFFQYTYFFIPVQVDIRHLLHFFKAKIRPFSLKYLSDTSECPDFLIMQITSSVTVHFVLSNVAKIHSKLPAAMEFCHLPVYFYES